MNWEQSKSSKSGEGKRIKMGGEKKANGTLKRLICSTIDRD